MMEMKARGPEMLQTVLAVPNLGSTQSNGGGQSDLSEITQPLALHGNVEQVL